MAGNRIIEFEEEGVIFILPQELDNVYIRREKIGDVKKGGDSPNRHVIRVSLLEIGDLAEDKDILGIDLTLLVYYDYDDLVHAKKNDYDKPLLFIHDGDDWRRPADKSVIYQSVAGSKKWLGFARVKMSRWDDPLISWGP